MVKGDTHFVHLDENYVFRVDYYMQVQLIIISHMCVSDSWIR